MVADARGFCGFPGISCVPAFNLTNNPSFCCSQRSAVENPQLGLYKCLPSNGQCFFDIDCLSGPCRGFMCPERYIVTVGDLCADAI